MITHMDEGIGQIVALVEELGLEDDTLIIFASDNGPTYDRLGGSDSDFFESAGPFRGRKGSVYEGGIRVPMVARWTGHIEPGTVTDHISAFWDVMPTMCDLAGVPIPDHVDGISFAPTLLGEEGQAGARLSVLGVPELRPPAGGSIRAIQGGPTRLPQKPERTDRVVRPVERHRRER
jgi:arylsulfatase A-like enzyme